MTLLVNDPDRFGAEAVDGLVAAHPAHLRRCRGGVVRARPGGEGAVSLVVGGGSGHYPAFAGWVGEGFAAGAACGGVFASPSASQIRAVARAAGTGGGVLLGYGRYAGDVLHFGLAAEMLRSEGVDVREIAIADDVASAPPEESHRRRGIAGDLVVLKVAGAAAEAGLPLDQVEALARRADARTKTLGVAMSGCTLPGAAEPLFTVPQGRMGIGLGIHGEPGLEERELGSADEVADLLVDGVLAEQPGREEGPTGYAGRVAVLLNGLGGAGREELLVLYRRVDERLRDAGLTTVRPEVGEHVTSLDMTGVSLTVAYLDEELEEHWRAACDAPAYRRPAVAADVEAPDPVADEDEDGSVPEASEDSRAAAARVADGVEAARDVVLAAADRLGEVDAVAGDGDHGIGMARGMRAAAEAARSTADAGAGAGTTLVRAGEAWAEGAGGTSGALWGAALTAAGTSLGDERTPGGDDVAAAVRAGVEAVLRLGGAQVGDKTMVDAVVPFVEALEGPGEDAPLARWRGAAQTAAQAAQDTAGSAASLGRARTHGERSVGTPDAGALSFGLVVRAVVGDVRPDDAAAAAGAQGGPR
ncbi:dihydroxyacetone kinase family protein [Pseudokineococcus sp. 1T1Z-3]|uniref:dihydroxyacetone kinase family protein n=1 Tax=Pseudokineococcus sp. 1T1Z-3 TaxID=3132745 RepID=UPI00309D862E